MSLLSNVGFSSIDSYASKIQTGVAKNAGTLNTLSALYQLGKIAVDIANGGTGIFGNGYRPPQWSNLPSDQSQLVLVKSNIGGLFFDAILHTTHKSTLQITEHPVQVGANISDHAFIMPSIVTMEIAMSDAMDSMVQGQFSDGYTKSVSAFKQLKQLQELRLPISVTTRLQTYNNMLVQSIDVPDDYKTLYGLRATVTLQEIFVVNVSTEKVSARQWTTGSTNRGDVQSAEIDNSSALSKILNDAAYNNPGGASK